MPGERGLVVITKGEQRGELCSNEAVVCVYCDDGYTNVHMW